MKSFKSILKNSTVVCSFIDSNFPTPAHESIIESVRNISSEQDSPSVVFIKPHPRTESKDWFEKMFEGVSFEYTDKQCMLDIVEDLDRLYQNVIVVDDARKSPLFEDKEFFGVRTSEDNIPSLYREFKKMYQGLLEDADIRKLFQVAHPPKKFTDITEQVNSKREHYLKGELFKVGSIVEDQNQFFEVLDRGSNYIIVVNESGETSKKFIKDVQESNHTMNYNGMFKGYQPSKIFLDRPDILESFERTIEDYNDGLIEDGFAILKTIKSVDSMLLGESVNIGSIQYSLNKIGQLDNHPYLKEAINKNAESQMQAAQIIAGAVGSSISGKTPEDIVNAAIKQAISKHNQTQIQILRKMLVTAEKVGLKYNKKLFESMDDTMLAIHRDQKLLKEKPTKDVLKAHQDLRKIGVGYEARDVGGKRAMISDILKHNHGNTKVQSYKSLSAQVRKSLDEVSKDTLLSYTSKAMTDTMLGKKDRNKGMARAYRRLTIADKPLVKEVTSYGKERAGEHDWANRGTPKVEKSEYHLIDKRTNKTVSRHPDAVAAVNARKRIRGNIDTHSVKKVVISEVHLDPDYKEEIDILGYEELKKQLSRATGIKNYGEKEPGEPITYVTKGGATIPSDEHTKPGHSLKASNDTHRRLKIDHYLGTK